MRPWRGTPIVSTSLHLLWHAKRFFLPLSFWFFFIGKREENPLFSAFGILCFRVFRFVCFCKYFWCLFIFNGKIEFCGEGVVEVCVWITEFSKLGIAIGNLMDREGFVLLFFSDCVFWCIFLWNCYYWSLFTNLIFFGFILLCFFTPFSVIC